MARKSSNPLSGTGIRFQKSQKVGKNARINMSGSGISGSYKMGPVTINSRGGLTVRLPGGLTFRRNVKTLGKSLGGLFGGK